jgi:hypothetical protein
MMTEHNVPPKVYVTEEEYVRLLNAAEVRLAPATSQALHARFGGNRVWLEEINANAWAFTLLLEWRGLDT